MSSENYVSRKSKLIKSFDRTISRVKPILISRYGKSEANKLISESHRYYEELIPQLPYIGNRNPMFFFLISPTRYLAIYKSMKKNSKSLEEIGRLINEICETETRAVPKLGRRVMEIVWFSGWLRKRAQKRGELSHQRKYPGDFVFNYVDGDGIDFDYGIDYLECASCKLYKAHGAEEVLPYVCATDNIVSQLAGWGLRRTTTLGEGGDKCDFRFKKGGKTILPVPEALL
jgi:hypothetical protein